ncbi:RNA ligase family protein [Dactylosporangium sp. NPDC005572]|uniref:RNA ligase family protein n=1 Tax=Dactylosporangium sp. NPDC005572 TaxID=3156889 RepID=UPI0033A3A25B
MTEFAVRAADLRVLNSLTKYPSIPTYHELDPRNGGLLPTVTSFSGSVIATEKVDGTNSRLVLLPDGTYLIGSREELLYAQGDLIGNPALGIVEQLKPVASRLIDQHDGTLRVYYLELYGGKVGGAAKQYTRDASTFGWRLFDVLELADWPTALTWPPSRIATWRESGGQPFADESTLLKLADAAELELTPRLFTLPAADLPTTIEATLDLLRATLPTTRVSLDPALEGTSEGMVFRTETRTTIAKARFQDYERTLKRRR